MKVVSQVNSVNVKRKKERKKGREEDDDTEE
jgi:hypothetical protein